MSLIGYLINHPGRLEGTRGLAYDYVLAGNGLFLESEGPLMAARVLVEEADVRGLAPLEPKLVLRHGKVHGSLWELALNVLIASSGRERYVAIVRRQDDYELRVPPQEQSAAGIAEYYRTPQTVVDIHSHPGTGEPHFSMTDDGDEIGFQVYGVVSNVAHGKPFVRLRVGIYGYWQEIPWSDVFSGVLVDVQDCFELPLTVEDVLEWPEEGSPAGRLPSGVSFQHGVDGEVVMEHGPEGIRR